MRSSNLILGGAAILAIGFGAAYLSWSNSNQAIAAEAATDGPGPNLVLEVAGESNGEVVIDLLPDLAPEHVARIVALANEGAYDGVVFHRVIDGFMAQTGDVEFGRADGDTARAGMGGSTKPDLKAEFSDEPFARGVVGMARSANPDSANSQFFIMFDQGDFLNGQYTVFGRVIDGMDVVDAIKKGDRAANGAVTGEPDRIVSATVVE